MRMLCFQRARIGVLVSLCSWSLSCAPAPLAIPPAVPSALPPVMPPPVSPMGSGSAQMMPMKHFEAYGFYEDKRSDIAHGMVCVDMIHLFVLRSNARYADSVARARAVAQVLEGALLQGNAPHFLLGKDGGDPALYAFPYPGGRPRRVVTVTAEDAAGYSLRSGRTVDPGRGGALVAGAAGRSGRCALSRPQPAQPARSRGPGGPEPARPPPHSDCTHGSLYDRADRPGLAGPESGGPHHYTNAHPHASRQRKRKAGSVIWR